MALTKAEMSEYLFDKLGLSKRDAKELVELFFEEIRRALENGEQVKLSGFGNFDLRDKNQRPGRNPKTGEDIPITARRVVTFRPGQKLKSRVENASPKDGNTTSGSKGQNAPKDPRIGSKTPIPLGVTEKVTKQHKPKSEKPMLSPQAELELLETDERLDALLERLEAGETLSAEEQSWVDAKLDRIDELMQKLGLSYDDDEEEEEDEKQEDMMRLLRGN